MSMPATLFVLALLAQTPPVSLSAQPIACEFRVFDGPDEVTRETRVRIYADGRKQDGVATDAAGRVSLRSGLYDVQMIRERDGKVTAIRWIEHLLIMRYPDEEGHHLEAANFRPEYGALEVKTVDPAQQSVEAFAAGDRSRPVASARRGEGYLLLVLPAGRYDVRVKPIASNAPASWLTDIDVPAGRTRLRSMAQARQNQE